MNMLRDWPGLSWRRLFGALCVLLVALAAFGIPKPARADSANEERLQVADPYIELRTGPGRGYPVFFVAARSEWISIELRHTDWYKVRTAGGKVGWVNRTQLQTTLTEAGATKTFRDVAIDDYLSRRLELGGAWGMFSSEPMLKLWLSYRLSDTLSLEGTLAQVQGTYSGSDLWSINLMSEPWSDQRFSPFFGVGFGQFMNFPNESLVGATTSTSNTANAIVGARYHLSERFVVRIDGTLYTTFLSDTKTTEYWSATVGLSFFFQ